MQLIKSAIRQTNAKHCTTDINNNAYYESQNNPWPFMKKPSHIYIASTHTVHVYARLWDHTIWIEWADSYSLKCYRHCLGRLGAGFLTKLAISVGLVTFWISSDLLILWWPLKEIWPSFRFKYYRVVFVTDYAKPRLPTFALAPLQVARAIV